MKIGRWGVTRYGFQESGPAFAAICSNPAPEVGTFARAPQRTPRAAKQGKIEQDDCIRGTKADFDRIIGPEVAIHNPPLFANEFLLDCNPFIARSGFESGSPENFVQLNHRQARSLAQAARQSRFA